MARVFTRRSRARRRLGAWIMGVSMVGVCVDEASAGAVSIGLHGNSNQLDTTTVDTNDIDIESGGGGAMLSVGVDVHPSVHLRIIVGSARHTTNDPNITVRHDVGTLEIHHRLAASGRARPYVLAGLGGSTLRVADDIDAIDADIAGAAASIGFGVLTRLSAHLSMDIAARLDLINWTDVTVRRAVEGTVETLSDPVAEDGRSVRVLWGLSWRF